MSTELQAERDELRAQVIDDNNTILDLREANWRLLSLLLRCKDAVEALDGTNVENERLVDDYRAATGGSK